MDVIRRVVKEDGFRGLWKGQLSCLAREVPGNMAWFGVYEVRARGREGVRMCVCAHVRACVRCSRVVNNMWIISNTE